MEVENGHRTIRYQQINVVNCS